LFACVLALGCGNDDVHHLNDGGGDAAPPIDAAAVDAPPTPGVVTVTVTDGGSAAPGAVVYFLNADNSVVAEKMTDGSGVASATMAPGGSVTVIEPAIAIITPPPPPPSPAPHVVLPGGGAPPQIDDQAIITWVGVKPGDDLRDDLEPVSTGPTDVDDFSIVVPTDPDPAAVQYSLFTTCQNESQAFITPPVTLRGSHPRDVQNNPPIQIELAGCGSATDMVVETSDQEGNLVDTLFVSGATVANDTTLTLTGTYAPAATETITATNAPAEIGDILAFELYLDPLNPLNPLLQVPNDTEFELSGGSGSGTLLVAAAGLGSSVTTVSLVELLSVGNVTDEQQVVSWGPALPTDVSLDVGATHLTNWVTSPEVDPVDGLVTWATTKAGTQPDYVITYVQDFRPDAQSGATNNWHWVLFAPGSEDGSVAFPQLPTDVFDFNWRDTDAVFVGGSFDAVGIEEMGTIGVQSPGGYDAARAGLFDALQFLTSDGLPSFALTGTGQIVVQQSTEGRGVARRPRHAATHRTAPHRVATRNGQVAR
jgi:hypothetical protein